MPILPAQSLGSLSQLSGRPVTHPNRAVGRLAGASQPRLQRRQLRVSAQKLLWPDQELISQTLESFPDKGVANVEEARALVTNGGYKYLDVRPQVEFEDVGKVTGSVNVPQMYGEKKWSPKKQKKVFRRSENPDFVKQVEKRFPDKETKLLIGCSNGKHYTMDALMALDEAGYTNIVGLKGGYNAWFQTFDNKGGRRMLGEYEEDHFKGGDSTGIHGSGQGFARSDFVEKWTPPEYEDDEEEDD